MDARKPVCISTTTNKVEDGMGNMIVAEEDVESCVSADKRSAAMRVDPHSGENRLHNPLRLISQWSVALAPSFYLPTTISSSLPPQPPPSPWAKLHKNAPSGRLSVVHRFVMSLPTHSLQHVFRASVTQPVSLHDSQVRRVS